MSKFMSKIFFVLALFIAAKVAWGQSAPTAISYLNYYRLTLMTGSNDALLNSINQKIRLDKEVFNEGTPEAEELKVLDINIQNYLSFKKHLNHYLSGYKSKKNLDIRILQMMKSGVTFYERTLTQFEQNNYEKKYNQSYLEGFFTQNEEIKKLNDTQRLQFETYGQALDNAINSYVKILALQKEILDAQGNPSQLIIDEVWTAFDRFLPVGNPKNKKPNIVKNDVANTKPPILDSRIKFWNNLIIDAAKRYRSKPLSETIKSIRLKAIEIDAALSKFNTSLINYPAVYNENDNVLNFFKISQASLENVPEYQEYVSKYIEAVAEGPGMLLTTQVMSDESKDNSFYNAAIGGLRSADDFKRLGTTLPHHNTDPDLINERFVRAAILEALNNIVLAMEDFKTSISKAKAGEKQLNEEVLEELINFFPEAIAISLVKHPEYINDGIAKSVAGAIISIDNREASRQGRQKIMMWAGVSVGVICLATGILSWTGSGLISLSVATNVSIVSTIFNIIDGGYQYSQKEYHNKNYQLLRKAYITGNTDAASIKDAQKEFAAFEEARLYFYIDGGFALLDIGTFATNLTLISKSKPIVRNANTVQEIGLDISRQKLLIATELYQDPQLFKLLESTGENADKFLLKLADNLCEISKDLNDLNEVTLRTLNKLLELPAEDLKAMIKEANNSLSFEPLIAIKNKLSNIKSLETEQGLDALRNLLPGETEYQNFMEYLGKLFTNEEITKLLSVDNLKLNPITSEVKRMKFLSEDFSPANFEKFKEFVNRWKAFAYVVDPTKESSFIKMLYIYQQSENIPGDIALFLAQSQNKKILEEIINFSGPMSLNNTEAFIRTLDNAEPFLSKLAILRNKPESLSRVLEMFEDIRINRPKIITNRDGSLNFNALCNLVDQELATNVGPIKIISESIQNDKDIVAVMWYPKGWGGKNTHTSILYKEKVYDAAMMFHGGEYHLFETEYKLMAKAAYIENMSFYKIELLLSPEEMEKMGKAIAEMLANKANDIPHTMNCIETTNKIISESTNIFIPFPISSVPTLTGKYLKIMHKLGYKKIAGVQFVGRNELKAMFSKEVFIEMGMATIGAAAVGGTIYAIVYFITKDGEVDPVFIEHTSK